MGLLDDAIREHLELKRRHGATEQELRRQEEEALGPARREVGAAAEEPEIEAVEDEDEDAARPVVGAEDGAPGGAEVDDELGAHPDEVEWEEPGPAAEEDGPDPERGRDEPLEREPLAHGPDDAEQEPVVETNGCYDPEAVALD